MRNIAAGKVVKHRKDARWLKELRSEIDIDTRKQEKIDITTKFLTARPDLAKEYRLKNFNSFHESGYNFP